MRKLRYIACLLSLVLFQSGVAAQNVKEKAASQITGPVWVSGSYGVISCLRTKNKEQCLTTSVSEEFGKIEGILRLKPLRNATTSWLVFTNKNLVICGAKVPTKQTACSPVEGFRDELRPAYPATRTDLKQIATQLSLSEPLREAGAQVSEILAAPVSNSKVDGTVSTMSDGPPTECEEGEGECDEDTPVIIIVGDLPGGGGGGGGGGGVPPEPIDPDTGLPYPQVRIYPPPPVFPKDLTWCSLVGLFCKTYEMPPPSPEWCDDRRRECYESATDLYVNNPNALPGQGPDMPSRYRIFVRECLARHGCQDY